MVMRLIKTREFTAEKKNKYTDHSSTCSWTYKTVNLRRGGKSFDIKKCSKFLMIFVSGE